MKLNILAAWAVGLVFIVSALAKFFPLEAFEITLQQDLGLNSHGWRGWLARLMISGEFTAGLLLILPGKTRISAAWLAGAILVLFNVFLVQDMIRNGNTGNCGCFGTLLNFTPLEAVIKNIISLLLLAFFLWKSPPRRFHIPLWSIGIPAGLLIACLLLFPMEKKATHLPDNSPFARFDHFEHEGKVNLSDHISVLAFLSLDCDHCQGVAKTLVQFKSEDGSIPVRTVLLGDSSEAGRFFEEAGGLLPWNLPPPEVFFEYLENFPPRIALLINGKDVHNWGHDLFSIQSLKNALRTASGRD